MSKFKNKSHFKFGYLKNGRRHEISKDNFKSVLLQSISKHFNSRDEIKQIFLSSSSDLRCMEGGVDNLELNPAEKFTTKSLSIKHNCYTFHHQSIVITFPIVPAYTARAITQAIDDRLCSSERKIHINDKLLDNFSLLNSTTLCKINYLRCEIIKKFYAKRSLPLLFTTAVKG
ncbi:hypothetical protein T05_13090 [Trichinella murrelli]|uniref:Uncharacterized protein n=1 Tax=Trichinella murrelli TaxID=144512 RepID=A0A0V0U0E7_9BILA|nr:hypothetical protein T05_13090 [Trichinella murrelli]